MTIRSLLQAILLLGLLLLSVAESRAQSAWVSDEFEITLRTGPSTSNEIRLMLGSGTRLEVLERDADSGYARVQTTGGTEGWVLIRYLMGEPAAREQLVTLTTELTSAAQEGTSLGSQLGAIKGEYDAATQRISALETDKASLEAELAEIRRTSANVLAVDNQNRNLRQQLTDAEIKISILEQENEGLASRRDRNWFITGALVLLIGAGVGLILPRMRFQRRSRYDSF
jgi:SH3 domain protein